MGRALDVIVRAAWKRTAGSSTSKTATTIGNLADPVVFSLSSAAIMWSWFFSPTNLPKPYRRWISSAAAVDTRLIEALRKMKAGEIRYGEDTGQAPLMSSMCETYGLPAEWGDPAVTIPYPCEVVHMDCGPSCEVHAVARFYRSFKWSLATYLPLSLALQLRKKPTAATLQKTLLSAARSSAFLGAFITLFYYGVCLARTRIGPRIFGTDKEACNKIDGGICVGTGCALCGWSIFLEAARRRPELALFVAPRAMATVLPRRYAADKEWREVVAFAASAAVLVCAASEDKTAVRGMFGRLVGKVLEK
ncbi:MAG: hypothetical protein IMZ46_00690 [Acidobacteria bacterium]|nr:hypothetical protein [Acidobacteriota bacterium]